MTEREGNRYEGQIRDGVKDGYGVMTYYNGRRYEGEWRNNAYAYGVLIWRVNEGYNSYAGEFRNNVASGLGVTNLTSSLYEGEHLDFRFSGYGKFTQTDNRFEGEWRDGRLNGWGDRVDARGMMVMGYWNNGQLTRSIRTVQR